MSQPTRFDVVVLGGGIIGALSAFEISKEGKKVVLLDKYPFAQGASGNSAAMLECQLEARRGEPFFSLGRASLSLFPTLQKEIFSLTKIDIQYEPCGILQLALTQEEAKALEEEVKRQKGMGLSALWIDSGQLKRKFPDFTESCVGAVFFAEDGQVNGKAFLEGALKAAASSGATLYESVGEMEFIKENDDVRGVQTSTESFLSGQIVVATGAWTDPVLEKLGRKLNVEPVRGQLALYETSTPLFNCPIYTQTDGYIVPKRDGTTVAGTTVERVGFDSSTTPEGKEKIVRQAETLISKFKTLSVKKMTAGLRPKSPTDLPIIGPLPQIENVIVATGHYRNGILLAPITAKIVSSLVFEREPGFDITPFLPRP